MAHLKNFIRVKSASMSEHKLHDAILRMPESQLSLIHEAVENGGRIESGVFYPQAFELEPGVAEDLKGHTHSKAALARHLRVNKVGGGLMSALKSAGQYAASAGRKFASWARNNPGDLIKIGAGVTAGGVTLARALGKEQKEVPRSEKVESLLADVMKTGGRIQVHEDPGPVQFFI